MRDSFPEDRQTMQAAWQRCAVIVLLSLAPAAVYATEDGLKESSTEAPPAASTQSRPQGEPRDKSLWHYGGFLDLAYAVDFNFPGNHEWRDRSTASTFNEPVVNMGAGYVRKDATRESRWGGEFLAQGGNDSKNFGFENTLPKVQNADVYRHFGRANVSYLAPVGNGLRIQAGLFNSFAGYESLYAKDNATYTRSWIADYSPYLMFGANAVYEFNDRWAGAFFVINGYFHLSNPNSLPSYGGQVTYTPSSSWMIKETVYYGPDQANTSIEFWRVFSDTIIEWQGERLLMALEYQAGTQKNSSVPANRRELFTGAQFTMRWHIAGPWSAVVRPEFYSDASGVITGHEQFVKAVTTTLQYKLPYQWTNTLCRLEYRYDESTGSGGGFFKGTDNRLTAGQNLLIFALIGTFDSP